MVGKVRRFKERDGRYSARLVVFEVLRSLIGKVELEMQLGGDRRLALARLPGAVASFQVEISNADRKSCPNVRKARQTLN